MLWICVENKENRTACGTITLSGRALALRCCSPVDLLKIQGKNMHSLLVITIVVVFSLTSAFAQSPAPAPRAKTSQQDSIEKQLRDADLAFAKATSERRLDGFMEFFAADAAIMQDGKTITGTEGIHSYYAPLFADSNFTLSWTPTKAEVSKDGSLGYTYGDYEARIGGKTSRGMYLTIWRKEAGKWKVVMDTGSSPAKQPKEAKSPN
jgi:ketosteroid isomerase-like protein